MKRFLHFIIYILLCNIVYAQQYSMGIEGEIQENTLDLEARTYNPKEDMNGRLCALIKVHLTNSLKYNLVLDVGGLGVIDRVEQENGDIWFYIPAQVKNLKFSCKDYTDIPKIPVSLKEATVYNLTIQANAYMETVTNVTVSSDFLKIKVFPKDASIRIGKTKSYEYGYQTVKDGYFERQLDYGTYYYIIGHDMYKPREGKVDVSAGNNDLSIELLPNYGYASIETSPASADVYIANKPAGKSPVKTDKLKEGKYSVRIQKSDYYSKDSIIFVRGDGSVQNFRFTLKPQFGNITCECEDNDAEIWIDEEYKGKGRWVGNLSSISSHKLEARKEGHRSQSISFTVNDGETTKKTVGAPIPLYGTITVQTSPAGCSVFIDDKLIGTSPKVINYVLVGKHTVTLKKDGFIPANELITLEHNQTASINRKLEKGTIYVPVSVSTLSSASIYIDGKYYGTGKWTGRLPEGEHVFSSCMANCTDGSVSRTLEEGKETVVINIPYPTAKTGRFAVDGRKNASVFLREGSGSFSKVGTVPYYDWNMPVGNYTAYASKSGYKDSPAYSFSITENSLTHLKLRQKKIYWITGKELYAQHFAEVKYGYGLGIKDRSESSHYIGLNYGYIKTHIGLHASAMYGIKRNDISVHSGPVLRCTGNGDGLDFQIYAGVGVRYDGNSAFIDPLFKSSKWHWSADAGVRFNIDNWNGSSDFSWASLSLGCQFSSDQVVPNIGVSLFPKLLTESTEYNFSRHFLNVLLGYDSGNEDVMMGGSYAWIKTHLGVYTSFLIGFGGGYSITAGPVVRLTTDLSALDLQLFGGCGIVNDCFGGDFGIRFGWRDRGFSLWDFSIGCQVYDGGIIPTIGIALGIASAGMAAISYM